MPRPFRNVISGRTSLAALVILALLVLSGSLVLGRRAQAQGGFQSHVITFAPVLMRHRGSDAAGVHGMEMSAWLPAVQRGDRPFACRVDMGDGSVDVLNAPPDPDRSMVFFDIYLTPEARGGNVVHIRNRKTGEEATAFTMSNEIDPCWLPAVQSNGNVLDANSVGLTVLGSQNTRLADGSVLPIPFQYAAQR
jgi:hypothetical protein